MYDPARFPAPPQDDLSGMPATVREKVERFKLSQATPDELAAMAASYYGLISHIDWHIGTMLDALERRNLLDNTVIIYSTDHGEMLGEHGLVQKSVFYEGAVRIPLIIRFPQCVRPAPPTHWSSSTTSRRLSWSSPDRPLTHVRGAEPGAATRKPDDGARRLA